MKAIVQYTSLDAYLHISERHLCNAQKKVYETISRLGEASDKDIAEVLGWPINRVTPRRGELHGMNRIICTGERQDPRTHRREMIWRTVR